MIDFYNANVTELQNAMHDNPAISADDLIKLDPTKISWTRGLRNDYGKLKRHPFQESFMRIAMYRPFVKTNYYFDRNFNDMVYQIPKLFPTPQTKNLVICCSGIGVTKDFSVIISDIIPDLELIGKSQCFPLYYYEKIDHQELSLFDSEGSEYICHDGITDFALERARQINPKISKEDIFYYIYGLLHSPEYKTRFSADLKKSLPHILFPEDFLTFKAFSKAGRDLAKIHLNYEHGALCNEVIVSGIEMENFSVQKMKFVSKDDKRTIIFNDSIKIENIPLQAYEYVINGKSAIEWIMERYAFTVNQDSKITNNPNVWSDNPRYVLDLLLRVIQLSLDTLHIIAKLPVLNFTD